MKKQDGENGRAAILLTVPSILPFIKVLLKNIKKSSEDGFR